MTFKPRIWQPIALILSVINLVAVGSAASAAESWHAATHAALAMAFGWWALRLGQAGQEAGANLLEGRVEALEGELSHLRGELSEAQERLDFAERILARVREDKRLGPDD
jgi:hypothetical protein